MTEAGKVYSSNNEGASFTLINPNLRGADGDLPVLRVIYQPDYKSGHAKSEYIILQGCLAEVDTNGFERCTSKYHWASKDLGETWIQPCGLEDSGADCFKSPTTEAGGSIETTFRMDPSDPERLLVKLSRKACEDRDWMTSDGACGHDLYYSGDFGKSWINLTERSKHRVASFVDFDWAPSQADQKPGIMATVYEDLDHFASGGYGWDYNVHFVYSEDLFASPHEKLMKCGNAFEILNKDVYVAKVADCEEYHASADKDPSKFTGSQVSLQISTDGGRKFNQACFPVSMDQNGYTIFDWNEDVAGPDFIVVDHDEEDEIERAAPIGNIYSSDASGQLYSLSMRRTIYLGGAVDFINVEGIPGVYFANQVAAGGVADPAEFVQTRVTYNNGGAWQSLAPPAMDVSGKTISCQGTCALHLHGSSSWDTGTWETRLGSVYSHASAPGVILATGNVGHALSFDPTKVNTYLSRDSGITWFEILQGPHIYEFGNKGGLIVAAKMASLGPATKLQFSRDEGESWEDLPLAREMNVHNIRVDPSADGQVLVVHGTDSQNTSGDGDPDGVLYTVDFSKLKDASGNAFAFPACDAAADYEIWNPKVPGDADGCILGKKYTMERRKRDSCCLNDNDYERTKTTSTTCACDAYDTECQYGAERLVEFGECNRMPNVELDKCPALVGQQYPNSNKRMIAGTACTGDRAALGVGSFKVGDSKSSKKREKKSERGAMSEATKAFLAILIVFASLAGFAYAYGRFDLGRYAPEGVRRAMDAVQVRIDEMLGRRAAAPAGYFEPLGDFDNEEL